MEIRFSNKTDVTQLKYIWKVCFGDSDDYIDFFFQKLFKPNQTVVACCEGKTIGVVYLLKATLLQTDFMYGYAIGVLPEYRGNSACQQMVDFIREEAKQKDFLFGLHPANEKLFSFYKRIGLKEMYRLKTVDASNFHGSNCFLLKDITAKDYFRLREQTFENIVSWDVQMIDYIITEAKATSGFAKKINIDGQEKLLLGRVYNNTVFVKETTMSDADIKAASHFIKHFFRAAKIVYTLPIESVLTDKMDTTILGFENERQDVYMNLFLD